MGFDPMEKFKSTTQYPINDLIAVFKVMKGTETKCYFFGKYVQDLKDLVLELVSWGVLTHCEPPYIVKDTKGNRYDMNIMPADKFEANASFERL